MKTCKFAIDDHGRIGVKQGDKTVYIYKIDVDFGHERHSPIALRIRGIPPFTVYSYGLAARQGAALMGIMWFLVTIILSCASLFIRDTAPTVLLLLCFVIAADRIIASLCVSEADRLVRKTRIIAIAINLILAASNAIMY